MFQVHCLQFLIYEVVSGGNLRKPGGLFGNSASEIPINDLKQLETFFYKLSFFLHIFDYTGTLSTLWHIFRKSIDPLVLLSNFHIALPKKMLIHFCISKAMVVLWCSSSSDSYQMAIVCPVCQSCNWNTDELFPMIHMDNATIFCSDCCNINGSWILMV